MSILSLWEQVLHVMNKQWLCFYVFVYFGVFVCTRHKCANMWGRKYNSGPLSHNSKESKEETLHCALEEKKCKRTNRVYFGKSILYSIYLTNIWVPSLTFRSESVLRVHACAGKSRGGAIRLYLSWDSRQGKSWVVCAHGGVTNKDGHIYISTDKQIDCSSHKQGGFRHWRKKWKTETLLGTLVLQERPKLHQGSLDLAELETAGIDHGQNQTGQDRLLNVTQPNDCRAKWRSRSLCTKLRIQRDKGEQSCQAQEEQSEWQCV